eukprot:Colp12_sorted_trinity150504_noHs@34071
MATGNVQAQQGEIDEALQQEYGNIRAWAGCPTTYSPGVLIGNWSEDRFDPSDVFPKKHSHFTSTQRMDYIHPGKTRADPMERASHAAKQEGNPRHLLFEHHGGYNNTYYTMYNLTYNQHGNGRIMLKAVPMQNESEPRLVLPPAVSKAATKTPSKRWEGEKFDTMYATTYKSTHKDLPGSQGVLKQKRFATPLLLSNKVSHYHRTLPPHTLDAPRALYKKSPPAVL